jgi:hypothetical protein
VNRRRDDVRRAVAGELDDVLAQVGLGHFNARRLQRFVKVNLLAGHRFGLDDPRRLTAADDLDDGAAGGCAVVGPVDDPAAGRDRIGKLRQVPIELRQRLVLDRPGPLADQVRSGQGRPRFAVAAAQRIAELTQDLLQFPVRERIARGGEKLVVRMPKVLGVDHRRQPSSAKMFQTSASL